MQDGLAVYAAGPRTWVDLLATGSRESDAGGGDDGVGEEPGHQADEHPACE